MQISRSQILVTVILSLAALVDSMGYTLLVNVLPCMVDVTDPLHYAGIERMDPGTVYSILQFSFVFGAMVFPPFIGKWSDIRGRKPVLILCLLIVCVTYYMQSLATEFWWFSFARFLSGFSGGIRPVAIAYISDMVYEQTRRCKLITSLSLVSAFSVGFGPSFGAHLSTLDRRFPFCFLSICAGASFVLTLIFLPQSRPELGNDCTYEIQPQVPRRIIYMLLIILGFSTYFMAMSAAIAFPLSLKESFGFSPVQAGLCSLLDGPLIFASNFVFMHKFNSLSIACKASIVASAGFCFIALTPNQPIAAFLTLKYITSICGPILFCTIPQTLVSIYPSQICGKYGGLIACSHGAGRLAAAILVGPLFEASPTSVYNLVAACGAFSAVIFMLLHNSVKSEIGKTQFVQATLNTPLISRGPSRSVSRVYSESFMPPLQIFNLKD